MVLLLCLPVGACSRAKNDRAHGKGRLPEPIDAGSLQTAREVGPETPKPGQVDGALSDAIFDVGQDMPSAPSDAGVWDAAREGGPEGAADLAPDLVSSERVQPADAASPEVARSSGIPSTIDYFATCPSAVPKAGDVDVEIFILAGQSNAGGHGRKVQLANRTTRTVPAWAQNQANGWTGAPTTSSDTGIMYPMPDACDGTMFALDPTSRNATLVWESWLDQIDDPYGPEVAFIADVQRRMPGHRFAMLKTALGGSSIESDWNPNLRGLTFDALVRQIQAAKASLSASGRSYRFVGMLWMQGENGAASINNWQSKSTRFADLTKQLFASIRSITDANMPIVLGRIGDQMLADGVINAMVSTTASKEQLLAAVNYRRSEQVRVARETSACAWVDSDGLPVLQEGDPALWYHHTGPGELALGERFAKTWAALVGR